MIISLSLTPLDSSFSTAAFSRAMSPRTILKTSCFQKVDKLFEKEAERKLISKHSGNMQNCRECVKGDFHMLGHCTMTKAEKCH